MGEHLIMCLYRTLWFVIIALLHIRVSFGILSHRAVPEKDTHKLHSYERKTFTEFVQTVFDLNSLRSTIFRLHPLKNLT